MLGWIEPETNVLFASNDIHNSKFLINSMWSIPFEPHQLLLGAGSCIHTESETR